MAYLIASALFIIGAATVLYWSLCALWYVWILVQTHRDRPS